MTLYYSIVRSDGAVIAGPYATDGISSVTVVDLAAEADGLDGTASSWGYSVWLWSDAGDACFEVRLTAMVAKR